MGLYVSPEAAPNVRAHDGNLSATIPDRKALKRRFLRAACSSSGFLSSHLVSVLTEVPLLEIVDVVLPAFPYLPPSLNPSSQGWFESTRGRREVCGTRKVNVT